MSYYLQLILGHDPADLGNSFDVEAAQKVDGGSVPLLLVLTGAGTHLLHLVQQQGWHQKSAESMEHPPPPLFFVFMLILG